MWRGAVIFLAMCLMWQPAPAMGARLALLIANQKYTSNVGPLKNPHNDVVLVHKALVSIGFRPQDITVVLDAGRTKIRHAVRRYADRLAKAGEGAIGFFYYSGHGAAEMASRTNYLIPVDVIDVGDALWDESVRLSYVIDRLQLRAPKAAHFVVFDACRNELRLRGTKALEKGFVPVTARRGMLIGYSTDLGQTASDEGPQSGPYAAALAAELGRSGRRAGILFDDIKFRVYRNTNEKQLPWHISKFTTPIFLAAKVPPPVSKPTSAPAPVVAKPPVSEAARAWDVTKDTTSTAVLRTFIKLYKDSVLSELARARVRELEAQAKTKRDKVALLPPAGRPAGPAGASLPTTAQGACRGFAERTEAHWLLSRTHRWRLGTWLSFRNVGVQSACQKGFPVRVSHCRTNHRDTQVFRARLSRCENRTADRHWPKGKKGRQANEEMPSRNQA